MNGLYLGPENGGVPVHLKDVTSAFHGFDFSQTKRFQNYGRKENKRTQVGSSPLTCKKIGSNRRSRCDATDTGLYLFCQRNTLEIPGFPVLGSRVFHAVFAGSLL